MSESPESPNKRCFANFGVMWQESNRVGDTRAAQTTAPLFKLNLIARDVVRR